MRLKKIRSAPFERPGRGSLKLLCLAVALAFTTSLTVRAGDICYDLNTDPAGQFVLVSTPAGSAAWQATGGVGGSGCIKLLDNIGQSCAVLFPDFDAGLVVASFEFSCMIKCGDWYNSSPADGFSVNYCSANDPIITVIEVDGNDPGRGDTAQTASGQNGWAGTQDVGGTENNLPEEGTKTGLAVGFDTWGYGTAPVGGSNGAEDARGISVRVDNVLIDQIPMPDVLFAQDYDFLGDATTLITGGFTCGPDPNNGNVGDLTCLPGGALPATGEALLWAPLRMTVDEGGILNVWWKDVNIVENADTGFSPRPGRILFGGSTGGSMMYTAIDDICVTTFPSSEVIVSKATGNPIGFTVDLIDSGLSEANLDTVVLTLDGNVVPTLIKEKTGSVSTVGWYDVTMPQVIGSTHIVGVALQDTQSPPVDITGEVEYTVGPYETLPPEYAVTDVNTGQPGFQFRVYQSESALSTLIGPAERQLQGLNGPNVADLTMAGFTGDVYAESGVINYSQQGADGATPEPAGVFQESTGFPDAIIPGIPSGTVFLPDEPYIYTDNIAAEITTYLQFAEAGVYKLYFNSDDGFRTTTFSGANEVLDSAIMAQYDGGRGASDTVVTIYVPAAGYYPFRSLWFEGGGGANLEWSAEQDLPTNTDRELINYSSGTSLKAYQSRTSVGPAVVTFTDPFRTSGNPYMPTMNFMAKIEDGDTAVDQSSIKMLLNGEELATTISKSGTTTTVTHDPAGLLPGGDHVLGIQFTAGAQSYDSSTTFTIRTIADVPPSLALPASEVNTSLRGFVMWGSQRDGGLDNNTYPRELHINGLFGYPNIMDLSMFTGPQGTYVDEFVINYQGEDIVANPDAGYFSSISPAAAPYGDVPMPGIPGTTASTDNYTLEILTVLELQAGMHAMNVNSDDGFRMTIGNPDEYSTFPVTAGEFDGGRGAGGGVNDGTTFYFNIQQAGLYPVRMLYYEGGGGSSIEWSSRGPIDLQTGALGATAILINDDLQTGYVPAYQYPLTSAGAPYVKSFAPGHANRTSGASPARAGTDATLKVVLGGLVDQVADASISVMLNGNAVTPTITTAGGEKTIAVTPADAGLTGWPAGTHDVAVSFGGRTISWTVAVQDAFKTPVFFIETEDFNNNGMAQASASVMPYMGGAYAGMSAVFDVDYNRADNTSSPEYRLGENPNVPMNRNDGDRDRGLGEVYTNYKLGWTAANQWYTYTRDIPAGEYNVYAAISHGETGAGVLDAALQLVEGATLTDLGVFSGTGTGGWGNNGLVPLTESAGGSMVALDWPGGPATVRYTINNGDHDFFMMVPAAEAAAGFTGIVDNGDGTITLEWSNGGTLQSAADVNGPYSDVTGATSGQPITPTGANEYYRVMY